MGNACTKQNVSAAVREQMTRTKEIDRQIRVDKRAFDNTVRMLLLGAGETGKSTFAKQMKILYLSGYGQEELLAWKEVIHTNCISWARELLRSCRALMHALKAEKMKTETDGDTNGGVPAPGAAPEKLDDLKLNPMASLSSIDMEWPVEDENQEAAQAFMTLTQPTELGAFPLINTKIACYLKILWSDKKLRNLFNETSDALQIGDSAKLFFNELDRITASDYVPTVLDVLRARVRTTCVSEISFEIDKTRYQLVDVGGQRSERRKWISCFSNVTAVIFFAALSEYTMPLREDASVNRIHESLKLFDDTVNSKWFANTPVILFLNKKDLFESRLKQVPLKTVFTNYDGPNEFDPAAKFIADKFMRRNKQPNRQIYAHMTCATDTENIVIVWAAVRDILLAQTVESTGLGTL